MIRTMLRLLTRPLRWLAGLLLLTTTSEDDEQPRPRRRNSIGGFGAVEDLAHVENNLKMALARQDQAFPAQMEGGGGGLHIARGRVLLEAGGSGAGADEDGLSLGYGTGYCNAGLVLFDNGFLRIFAMAGPGGSGGGYDLQPGDAEGDEEAESESIGWGAVLVNGGIGVDITLRLWRIGLMVGVRAGYNYPVMTVESGTDASFEPPVGPYFRFVFGPRFFH